MAEDLALEDPHLDAADAIGGVRLGLCIVDVAAQRVQRNPALAIPFGTRDLGAAEAARRAITRHIRRQGRLWIRIFPDVPVSSKPAEVRMGSGKGSPEFWVARVKPGRILFELDGVPGHLAKVAFERAAEKLPIKVKVVARLGESMVEED